jgi:diacylglycerol kinase (ATP)
MLHKGFNLYKPPQGFQHMILKSKIIYNPAAGKGSAGKNLPKIQAFLHEQGFDGDLVPTQGPGHAIELSRQAAEDGYDLVVAAGGDGTVNETIIGLMLARLSEPARPSGQSWPALGVLPVGSGNDFAFGVNIPQDIHQACETLGKGQRRLIDVGWVTGGDYPQGRYFVNGVGLGFDAVVGFEAAKIKWLHGAASYLVAVVRTLFLYGHEPIYEVFFDGTTLRQPFLMVSVMNGRRMGGSFLMAPEGNPGDGKFDLYLVGQVSQLRILPLATTFFNGKQGNNSAVKMMRARQVSIRAIEGTIPAHANGETLCTAGQALSIEIFPGVLEVVSRANGENA